MKEIKQEESDIVLTIVLKETESEGGDKHVYIVPQQNVPDKWMAVFWMIEALGVTAASEVAHKHVATKDDIVLDNYEDMANYISQQLVNVIMTAEPKGSKDERPSK